MPRPEHSLHVRFKLETGPFKLGHRVLVMAICDVRRDDVLMSDDGPTHAYGVAARSTAHVAEGTEAFNTLAEALHRLHNDPTALPLWDVDHVVAADGKPYGVVYPEPLRTGDHVTPAQLKQLQASADKAEAKPAPRPNVRGRRDRKPANPSGGTK